jgi:hypothetical protein
VVVVVVVEKRLAGLGYGYHMLGERVDDRSHKPDHFESTIRYLYARFPVSLHMSLTEGS